MAVAKASTPSQIDQENGSTEALAVLSKTWEKKRREEKAKRRRAWSVDLKLDPGIPYVGTTLLDMKQANKMNHWTNISS